MNDFSKTNQELTEEITALKKRIKQLKQSAAQIRRVEGALRESEEKYRTIIEQMEDGYFEVPRLIELERLSSWERVHTLRNHMSWRRLV
jgi:hypothetical protein